MNLLAYKISFRKMSRVAFNDLLRGGGGGEKKGGSGVRRGRHIYLVGYAKIKCICYVHK